MSRYRLSGNEAARFVNNRFCSVIGRVPNVLVFQAAAAFLQLKFPLRLFALLVTSR
jgi:hypothetical protein